MEHNVPFGACELKCPNPDSQLCCYQPTAPTVQLVPKRLLQNRRLGSGPGRIRPQTTGRDKSGRRTITDELRDVELEVHHQEFRSHSGDGFRVECHPAAHQLS